jgi:hypothetical protein
VGTRLDLQALLEGCVGSDGKVYFEPPVNVSLIYPCIIYNRNYAVTRFADNTPYSLSWRYQVVVIDRNPDSSVVPAVAALPMSTYVRHFAADGLNHDIFYLYF